MFGKNKELLKRIRQDDLSAFDEIYKMSQKAVYFAIYVIHPNNEICEDLSQETYLDFLRKKPHLKKDEDIVPFLVNMAKNKALDLYRRKKKEGVFPEDSENFIGTHDALESDLIDKIKEGLTDKEYRVFILKALGEYSFQEISEMTQIPLGTCTWLYQEARKKLQEVGKAYG